MDFRPLNQSEVTAIESLLRKGHLTPDQPIVTRIRDLEVSYESHGGGFCVCLIIFKWPVDDNSWYLIWRGASRRSYKDKKNQLRGQMLAFRRAVLFSKPISV